MRPPFCNYRLDEGVRVLENGKTVADPLAIPLDCNCATGHFKDFSEQLERFNATLKLGFDCGNGCYIIYRDLPRIETLSYGPGLQVKAVTRQPLIIKPLQWVVIRKVRGGNKFFHFPRDPGNWVLRDMRQYRREQFELDASWVGPTADAYAKQADRDNKQKIQKIAGDIWDDVMTVADKGNPLELRTSVMVSKKAS